MKCKLLLIIVMTTISFSAVAQYGGHVYRKIIAENVDKVDSESRYQVALAYESLRQYDQAYALLEQLYLGDNSNKSLLYDLARVSRLRGQIPISILWLEQAAVVVPDDSYTLTLLAETYLQGEQLDSTINTCHKILAIDSTNHQTYTLLGQAFQAKGRSVSALESYRRAVSLSPRNLANVIRYITVLNSVKYSKEQFTDAVAICDTAQLYHPNSKVLLKIFGQFQYYNQQYSPAHNTFLKVISLGDSSLLTLKYAGITALQLNRDLDYTLSFLMPASMIDSTDMELLFSISLANLKAKKFNDALLYIKKLESVNVPNIQFLERSEDLRGSIAAQMGAPRQTVIAHYLNAHRYSSEFNANYLIKIYSLDPYSKNLPQEQREKSLYWMYRIAKEHIILKERNTRTVYAAINVFNTAVESAFMEGNDAVIICSERGERTIVTCKELSEMLEKLQQIKEKNFYL